MTLRGHLTAQLPLQACLTCRARLAHAFTASALVRCSLAALSNDAGSLTPFRAFLLKVASLLEQGAGSETDVLLRVPALRIGKMEHRFALCGFGGWA